MPHRRIPEWLRHPPAPGVRGFAVLAGIEAIVRGILISVFPLVVYNALQDASLVSEAYFIIGLVSLTSGLSVPFISRFIPRRWIYIIGVIMFITGALLATVGTPTTIVVALLLNSVAAVTTFVCFNAYVLDYIAKIQLSQCETARMFYSALGWTIGPVLGVVLLTMWPAAPFLLSSFAACLQLICFLFMRLGNGKLIVKSHALPPNPLAYMPRFAAQPRLITGWMFAVIRSCGWWVYVVYLPIFAMDNGLGDRIGGIALSISNAALFCTPIMLKWMQRHSIRHAVRVGFLMSGILFIYSAFVTDYPLISVMSLMAGSFFLILLDVSAGLPFLLAVRPSERTEMSAVYSSYRDVSGIVTPGVAWLVLLVMPMSGIFIASGVSLLGACSLARKLHPRLGLARMQAALDESISP